MHLNDVSQIEKNDLFLDENRPHSKRHNITQKKKIVGLLEKGKLDVLGILSTWVTDWGWPRDVDDAVDNHSLKVHDGQHLVIHRRVNEDFAEAQLKYNLQ